MQNIKIHEVGLRDGLQMENQTIPTSVKIRWAEQLISSGIDIIQLGSFVHPEYVPQMADSDILFKHFVPALKSKKIIVSGLALNEKGFERAITCGVQMICLGVSASEIHSKKNTKMGVDEALKRILAIANEARKLKMVVQLSVQSAFGCGYEGVISEEKVYGIVKGYLEQGFKNISLADTAGHANPLQVKRIFHHVKNMDPAVELTAHFHNTYAMALANCMAAIEAGVQTLESSFGGLGGCPFTQVAGGNVCTEDLVHMLQRMKICTQINLMPLIETTREAEKIFRKELPGMIYKTGAISFPADKKGIYK
jgi:hydroxymethylglutaryl-CoA lyase